MKNILTTLVIVLMAVSGCSKSSDSGKDASIDNPYGPTPQGGGVVNASKNLAYLQQHYLTSVIHPTPWAGYWFPYLANGISDAASKFDSAESRSATNWELTHHGAGLPGIQDWWGHCNGWAAAAVLSPEPRSSRSISSVEFTIADQKALLTEVFMEVTGDFIGTRVDSAADNSSDAFNDVVPAQFYLTLTSVMGSQKRAVIVDRYTGYQVWNQPLVAYENLDVTPNDYLGPDPQFPNIHRVNMSTRIWWTSDNVSPDIVTPAFDASAESSVFESRILRYELWLDGPPVFDAQGKLQSSGDIVLTHSGTHTVGGVWKNADLALVNSYPDYMWVPTGPSPSKGYKNPQVDDNWVISNFR